MSKIKGLKKAVGEYKRFNKGGSYSPEYGVLMYDTESGEIWTDYFYSLGHNSWKEYHNEAIVNLGRLMGNYEIDVTMENVKEFIEKLKSGKVSKEIY